MRIGSVIEVSTHANKDKYYLYNQVFSLAKEHNVKGEFGRDYFTLENPPEPFTTALTKLSIKFKEYFNKGE